MTGRSIRGLRARGRTCQLKAGITIIEGLDLSVVRPGRFDLACHALKITGGDGAPARAMLRAA